LTSTTPSVGSPLVGSQLLAIGVARYVLRLQPLASAEPDTIAAELGWTAQRLLTQQTHRGGDPAGNGADRRALGTRHLPALTHHNRPPAIVKAEPSNASAPPSPPNRQSPRHLLRNTNADSEPKSMAAS
jgi:hypothetical protein